MISVAVSNVVTTTQNLGISKATGQSNDSFNQVLKSSISTQKSQQKGVTSTQNNNEQSNDAKIKSEQSENVKNNRDDVSCNSENTSTQKKDEKKEVDSTGTITVQANEEQSRSDDVEETLEEIISEIAQCLGVTQNKLTEIMQTLKLSFKDLLTTKGIKELVNNSFGLTSSIDMLDNSKAFNAFKEIAQKVQTLLDEKQIEPEILKSLLDDAVNDGSLTNSQTVSVNLTSDNQQKDSGTVQQTQQISETQTQDTKDITINIEDLRNKMANQDGQSQQSGEKESNNDFLSQMENQFQNIAIKGSDILTSSDIKDMVEVEQAVNAKDIFNQVVNQVKIALKDDQTTMSIQLKPENLGKVAFSIRSQGGVLTGHFVAENNAAKEAIEMNLVNLKTSLIEQGIKFDEVKVVVGNTNQFFERDDQSRAFNQFSNNKRRRSSSNQAVESIGQKITEISEPVQELENDEHLVDFSA